MVITVVGGQASSHLFAGTRYSCRVIEELSGLRSGWFPSMATSVADCSPSEGDPVPRY